MLVLLVHEVFQIKHKKKMLNTKHLKITRYEFETLTNQTNN